MIEKQSNMDSGIENQRENDLLGILHDVIAIRKTLYKAVGIGLILGVVAALSVPKKYTVQVTLSPEVVSSNGNSSLAGLATSLLGNGAVGGDRVDALNMLISTKIVSSTPFLLDLSGIKVHTSENVDMPLAAYIDQYPTPWWGYIFKLPGLIIKGVKSFFIDSEEKIGLSMGGVIVLTDEESKMMDVLRESVSATVDKKTGITLIQVILPDPKVSAIVADSVIHKLKEYIVNYRISKAEEDCLYLERLFIERREEYYTAQKKYAGYVDTHDNIILQSVRTEQERLQNDMSLAYQVYSQVATQLQAARAKVQEMKPVFAIVEPAVVPLLPSGLGLVMYVAIFIFLSVVCTIVCFFVEKQYGIISDTANNDEVGSAGRSCSWRQIVKSLVR